MNRWVRALLVIFVLASVLAPQAAWARAAKNKHHVQHHKVRHVKRHHAHRTGA